jgi:glycine hydroxymethyltransferase
MILAREKFGKDIDRAVFPGAQGGPLVHVVAAKAVCFLQALSSGFREYQAQVIQNARALAAGLQGEGFRVVSGGTDSHMFLIDVFSKGVKGKEAEKALDEAFITVNKNAIPFDVNPPLNPSGIRLGSPAVTTRGFRESEMERVAELIANVLQNPGSREVISETQKRVGALTGKFPLHSSKRELARAL